jgi:GNAT superfamily N-acetyltransferase
MVAIRNARPADLEALSALCLRSKAHWGYDAAFLQACRAELTLRPEHLQQTIVRIAEQDAAPLGMVQVAVSGETADLLKLFVEPRAMAQGVGRLLMEVAVSDAQRAGAVEMTIEADPAAAPFYQRMGARRVGEAPSGAIPGRRLPLFVLDILPEGVN